MLHFRRMSLAVWLAALAVRLAALLVWGVPSTLGVDQSEYLALAQNLREHGAYSYGAPHRWGDRGILNSAGPYTPTAARAPLYPAMIAALWWGEAPPLLAICLVQAVLGAFVVVFVYLIAHHRFGPRPALLAALIMVLAPLSVYAAAQILADTLFCFLLSWHLWLWDRGRRFAAGLALGAAALARAVVLPTTALLALSALILQFKRRTHAMILLGVFLCVAPWTFRNVVTQHAFVPVATMGWGANVLLGTREVPYGSGNPFMTYAKDEDFTRIIRSAPSEAAAEAQMFQEGLRRIAKEPLRWLWIRITQYPRVFFEGPAYLYEILPLPRSLIRLAYMSGTAVFIVLAAVGLWLVRARWREIYHLALYPITLGATCFAGVTEERYSLAMVPMMAVFAGFALWQLTDGRGAATQLITSGRT